jgi:hypothetical protein
MAMETKRQRAAEARPDAECVASATECTGLMPALSVDEASDVSSASLYGIHDGKGARGKLYRKQ